MLEVVTGTALCTSQIGCVAGAALGVIGADNITAGGLSLLTGEDYQSFGSQLFQEAGLSRDQAEILYGLLGAGLELVAARALLNNADSLTTQTLSHYRNTGEFSISLPPNSPYSQADYDAYIQKKLNSGETPRSPEDYIAIRQQFDHINEQHNLVSADIDKQFRNQDFNVQTEVTLCGLGSSCRADQVISRPGANGAQVPDGYTATDLDGNQLDVIPLSSNGQAIIEIKTGDAGLTSNQSSVYPEVSQGIVSGTGSNAQETNLAGSVPADTPVVILRPSQ